MLHHVLSSFVGNGYLPFWWIDHFSATQTTRLGGWRSGRNRPRDGQVYLSNSKGHVGGKRLTAWEPLVWAWRDNLLRSNWEYRATPIFIVRCIVWRHESRFQSKFIREIRMSCHLSGRTSLGKRLNMTLSLSVLNSANNFSTISGCDHPKWSPVAIN